MTFLEVFLRKGHFRLVFRGGVPPLNVELGTLNLKPSYALNALNDLNYLNLPQEGLFDLPDKTKADAGAPVARVAPAPER